MFLLTGSWIILEDLAPFILEFDPFFLFIKILQI